MSATIPAKASKGEAHFLELMGRIRAEGRAHIQGRLAVLSAHSERLLYALYEQEYDALRRRVRREARAIAAGTEDPRRMASFLALLMEGLEVATTRAMTYTLLELLVHATRGELEGWSAAELTYLHLELEQFLWEQEAEGELVTTLTRALGKGSNPAEGALESGAGLLIERVKAEEVGGSDALAHLHALAKLALALEADVRTTTQERPDE